MPVEEKKTVDIDTSGPGAEVEILAAVKRPCLIEQFRLGVRGCNQLTGVGHGRSGVKRIERGGLALHRLG